MHTELKPGLAHSASALRAVELLQACVHCGFCLETCPTYLDNRDERDGPRGRIYLVKQLLEGDASGHVAQTHLDRCLQCRSCETACPSGMRYGELTEIAREHLQSEAPRPLAARILRRVLHGVLVHPVLFGALLAVGRTVRPLLPHALRARIPPYRNPGSAPGREHPRRVIFLDGCVQRAAAPATVAAACRVLDRLGITAVTAPGAGCCGALSHHLDAREAALTRMRRNIDAWGPLLEQGAEALVSTASGCGLHLSEYGRLLAHDPDYSGRAELISSRCRDLAEIIAAEDLAPLNPDTRVGRVAVHIPCTLQHGLGLGPAVPDILRSLGFELAATREDHLCCGSAGTYSILQPARSARLRQRKLQALSRETPDLIVSANIGCQLQLADPAGPPVRHWIELLDPG